MLRVVLEKDYGEVALEALVATIGDRRVQTVLLDDCRVDQCQCFCLCFRYLISDANTTFRCTHDFL